MPKHSLTHLSNATLLRQLSVLVARDRAVTAELLAHIAEVDARRLYAEEGFPSMFAYCVGELRLSEDSAGRRIHVARTARRFPILFDALDDGRLHLTAVSVLAPHLTEMNVGALVEAATHKGKSEIEAWLAVHFMAPSVPVRAFSIKPVAPRIPERAPEDAERDIFSAPQPDQAPSAPVDGADRPGDATVSTGEHALAHPDTPAPSEPEQFRMQVTISKHTHDMLRQAQALLSHAAAQDVAEVLDRALKLLVEHLMKRKAGETSRPRPGHPATRVRTIPAHVRREVWKRDQGRCTFVSASGRRCSAHRHLQFDHIQPVARGGVTTIGTIRLRCPAHNQLEADRVFGVTFMESKRATRRGS